MSTQTDESTAPAIEPDAVHPVPPEPPVEGMKEVTPNEVVTIRSRGTSGVLSIDPNQDKWTSAQVTALRSIGVETVGDDAVPFSYVWQFLHMCQKTDLDPWMREVYLITHGKRWVKDNGEVVDNRKFTLVTGIDGFRKKAEDTGQYVGQVGPQWCTEDGVWKDFWNPKWGKPTAARVGILRQGFDAPVWGVAMYDEFVPMVDEYVETEVQGRNGTYTKRVKSGGKTETPMWQKMGANQIAKCAEAQGFRKAFPRTMAGMYEAAEMQRAQADYEQQQADEQERQARSRRSQARTQAITAGAERAVAEPVKSADADPQPVGVVAAETVENLRAQATPEAKPEPAAEVAAPEPALSDEDRLRLLHRELTFQADVLGVAVERAAARPVKMLGKPIEEFTAEEMLKTVLILRTPVLNRLRQDPERETHAAVYATVGTEDVFDVSRLDPAEPVEAETDPADDERLDADPDEPHTYVNDGGVCGVCGEIEDNVIHPVDAG